MTVTERIRRKLTEAFAPEALVIIDESDRHAGHAGSRPGGETHFRIVIVSDAFRGRSRVARQRDIMDLLRAEMAERVHALSLQALTPEEAARR